MRYYDLSLERAVLQAVLYHFPTLVKLQTRHLLTPEYFSDLSYRRIFRAIIAVFDSGACKPNSKLVRRRLQRIKKPKARDKVLAVYERLKKPDEDSIHNVDAYIDELNSLFLGRRLQFMVKDMAGSLGDGNIADALAAVQKMTSTPDTGIAVEESDFIDIFEDTIELDKQKKAYPEIFRRFPSGIVGVNPNTGEDVKADRDILNGGFMRQTFILIAGDTGLGKSKTLSHIFRYGVRRKAKGVFVTNEMGLSQVKTDFVSGITGIDFNKIERGRLEEVDHAKIRVAGRKWKKAGVSAKIVSYPEVSTVGAFRAKLLEFRQQGFIADFAVLDYLNEMSPEGGGDSRGDWSGIGEIASDLRGLALSWDTNIELDNGYHIYGMPVITASQRKTSVAGKSFARTEDTAFSPVPAQIAAAVGHLTQDADMKELGVIDFSWTKCRFGRTGKLRLYPDFSKSRLHSKKKQREIALDNSYDLGDEDDGE